LRGEVIPDYQTEVGGTGFVVLQTPDSVVVAEASGVRSSIDSRESRIELNLSDIENKVICGDSLELLGKIPPNTVSLIITDPVWPGCKPVLPGSDDPIRLFAMAAAWFPNITDRVIVHLGQQTDPRMLQYIPDSLPFVQICWLRWIPPGYKGPVLYSADVAYVYGHSRLPGDGSRVFGSEYNSVSGSNDENVRFGKGGCPHPTPRSLDHVSYLVRRFSRPGDLILDPFCGSGTTLVAAKLAGRRYCGIDIKPEFVEYARERVNRPDLFHQEKPKPKPKGRRVVDGGRSKLS
jgi:hypothetical protein